MRFIRKEAALPLPLAINSHMTVLEEKNIACSGVLFIKQFNLSRIGDVSFFFTSYLSCEILNTELVDCLSYLKKKYLDNNIYTVDYDSLKSFLDRYTQSKEIEDCLFTSLNILRECRPNTFREIAYISDMEETSAELKKWADSIAMPISVIENTASCANMENSLVVYFKERYIGRELEEIYRSLHPSTYLVSAYFANTSCIIDSIYNKKKRLPCHFCNIKKLQMNIKSDRSLLSHKWLKSYREHINKNDDSPIPYVPPNSLQITFASLYLIQFLRQYIDPTYKVTFDEFNYSWHIDLDSFSVEKLNSVHFSNCMCQKF